MANQSPDRRQVLAMLAKAAAASQFPGFSRWVFAAEHTHEDHVPVRPANYTPLFFTPYEFALVDQVSELIIPKDTSPGAHDAGVAEFIDFMAAHDGDIQYRFRTGVSWLDVFAHENYARAFVKLTSSQQEELLTRLAYKANQKPTEVQGQEFFALIREYTVMGYYTSRIGMQELDDPGLKFYSASPECPHKDDPEHRHLTAARES